MTRAAAVYPANRLVLREVGLRDGLQMVETWPDTAAKERWLAAEHAAGIRHFEIGSFLPAARFPQFADLPDLARTAASIGGLHSIGLALNERGVRDAFAAGVGEIGLVISATEAHSRANQNRSRAESLDLVRTTLAERPDEGPLITVGISMAFGCSISGPVPQSDVLEICEALCEAGVDMIGLADTVGFGGPDEVGAMTRAARSIAGEVPICIHLHDTRGLGLANAAAAMDAGCRILDGALGGLGGCPFAPGATGNVVMEDLAFLAAKKGFETGIDLDALVAVRDILATSMPGETLHGAFARAGQPKRLAEPA